MFRTHRICRSIAIYLTACCMALTAAVFCFMPVSVHAESGSCGDNATWSFSNGTLTISGSGEVSTADWSGVASSVKNVVIERGITSLPSSAFTSCKALVTLTMADTVTQIGTTLCRNCSNLQTVRFSSGLKSIPASAFYGCNALTNLKLPDNLEMIEANAFGLCIALNEITIPYSCTTIGEKAFYGNNATKVTLGSKLQTIGKEAFNYCCFSTVTIPDNVKEIGTSAFGIVYSLIYLKSGLLACNYDKPIAFVTLYGKRGGAAEAYAATCNCKFEVSGTSEHTHSWSDWVVVKEAGCTEDGKKTRTCTGCGETDSESIPAIGHCWPEWKTVKEASCTEDGKKSRTCAYCGETETAVLPATGHNWSDWKTVKESSCTEEGKKTRSCANCGETETEIISAPGHNWSEWITVKEATCTEDGKQTHTCANCGETETTIQPATGHSWADWKTVKEATCTEDGKLSRTCANCGETETDVIPATGHSWSEWVVQIEATCTDDGSRTCTCENCGESQMEIIYASGHRWSDWMTDKAATCTADGEQSRSCANCGEKESRILPATGHNWSEWAVTEPTCTKDGSRVRTCANCGETEQEVLSATGHSWSDWKNVKAATCTETGTNERKCANCGETETEIVPAIGHSWSEWEVVTPAALDVEGSEKRTCANCGETETRTIPALTGFTVAASAGIGGSISPSGHIRLLAGSGTSFRITPDEGYQIADVTVDGKSVGSIGNYSLMDIHEDHQIFASFTKIEQQHGENDHVWTEWKVDTEAGCVSDGRKIRTCTICGEVQYQTIPATGHSFGDWETDIAATCTESGRNVRTCSRCGEKEYTEIPATGHNWSEWKVAREATPYDEGLEQRVCANCGEIESRTLPKLSLPEYTVTITCSAGGRCEPNGNITVKEGGSITVTAIPDAGFTVLAMLIDDVTVGSVTSYTIDNIRANRSVHVVFQKIHEPTNTCTSVIARTDRAAYLTDETSFPMSDFQIVAIVDEDGTVKHYTITDDCTVIGSPASLTETGAGKTANARIIYRGNNEAIKEYFDKNKVSVYIHLNMRGDGNANQKVDVSDALAALKAYGDVRIGLNSPLNDVQKIALDVDNNGSVSLNDAMYILRYYADHRIGLDTTWAQIIKK